MPAPQQDDARRIGCSEARGLWRRLADLPYSEQQRAIEEDLAFHSHELCRLLQRLSERACDDEPATAAQLANLAVRISERIVSSTTGDHDGALGALSYAYLGDARRRLGEVHSAGDAFDAARRSLAGATGCPAAEAEVAGLEALLLRDRRQLPAAIVLLDRAYSIYRGDGQEPDGADATAPRQAGRVRAHQAWCLYHSGRPEQAVTMLEEAEGLLDREHQRALWFAARHGRICASLSLARLDQAEALLMPVAETSELDATRDDRLRLRRAAGRLALAQGRRGVAEDCLREAANGFLRAGRGVDAALAFLDLAHLYLQEGEAGALTGLANEVLPVFSPSWQGHDLSVAGISAMLLFQQACWQDRLTIALLGMLADTIEDHRRPDLSWWTARSTCERNLQ